MQLRTICLGFMLPLACACVPILPHDEFVPDMPGSRVVTERCWGGKSVEYAMPGATLTSHIIKWPEGKLKLQLQLDVADGTTVEWLSPDITVTSGAGSRRVSRVTHLPGISLTGNPSLPLEPLGPMVAKDIVLLGFRSRQHFWLFAPMEDMVADEFQIRLPNLRIADRVVTFPEINFHRQVRLQFVAPVQC